MGAPVLHAEVLGNLAFRYARRAGDPDAAFARAEVRLDLRVTNNRVAAAPMEGRAVLSRWDASRGELDHQSSTQPPHVHARALATCLGLPMDRLRFVVPDVGGGFGAKLGFYAEDAICARLWMPAGRPCLWVEGRSEGFLPPPTAATTSSVSSWRRRRTGA